MGILCGCIFTDVMSMWPICMSDIYYFLLKTFSFKVVGSFFMVKEGEGGGPE